MLGPFASPRDETCYGCGEPIPKGMGCHMTHRGSWYHLTCWVMGGMR